MVITRSQGPAETIDSLPLRSRDLSQSSARTDHPRLPSFDRSSHHLLYQQEYNGSTTPATQDQTRSAPDSTLATETTERAAAATKDEHALVHENDSQLDAQVLHLSLEGRREPSEPHAQQSLLITLNHEYALMKPNACQVPPYAESMPNDSASKLDYGQQSLAPADAVSSATTSVLARAVSIPDLPTDLQTQRQDRMAPSRVSHGSPSSTCVHHPRQYGRAAFVRKQYHLNPVPRYQTSIEQFRAQRLARCRRTSRWPGKKTRFVVGR
jgi:hypothetical protein